MRYIIYIYTKFYHMKKTILAIIAMLLSFNANCQETFIIKTTEQYQIKIPSKLGQFKHNDHCVKWSFDLENQKISYIKSKEIKVFNFIDVKLNVNSTKDKKIYNFNGINESLTLISVDGNYFKIKLHYDKKQDSSAASYKEIKIFTNYIIDSYFSMLSD